MKTITKKSFAPLQQLVCDQNFSHQYYSIGYPVHGDLCVVNCGGTLQENKSLETINRRVLFGVTAIPGDDGAGLLGLPPVLLNIRNTLDLPVYRGSRTQLEEVVNRTLHIISAIPAVHSFERGEIKEIKKDFWERPHYQIIVQVNFNS